MNLGQLIGELRRRVDVDVGGTHQSARVAIGDRQQQILAIFETKPRIDVHDAARAMDVPERLAAIKLVKMYRRGMLQRFGKPRSYTYTRALK